MVILENCSLLLRSSEECEVKPGLRETRKALRFYVTVFDAIIDASRILHEWGSGELLTLLFIVLGDALWKES